MKPGFLAVYRESFDDVTLDDDDDRRLPAFETGDRVKLNAIKPEQHFTEPPPRFSEASLVKALEEYGIGRPSTYASIIQTLLYKKYCELINKRFIPTDLGKIVNRFLTGNFERYVDFNFTAGMEDELDNISRGEDDWVQVLDRFWAGLKKQIDDVEANVTRSDVAMARDIGVDPVSGRPVSVRYGKYGAFAQIGTRDDEEKPKFASLRPGQRMDDVTLADALELFKLPRTVGDWEDGYPIRVAVGRFGPYAQYGTKKYVSLKKEDDPYTITLERALQLIREKREIEANRIIREFPEAGIQVLNGRYGPYITDGKKNGKIPKDRDPKSLTLEECQALIAAAPERKGRWGRKTAPAKGAAAKTKDEVRRGRDGRRRREAGEKESCAEEEGGREEVCCKEESAGEERVLISTPSRPAGGNVRRALDQFRAFSAPQQSRDDKASSSSSQRIPSPRPRSAATAARCSGVAPSNRGNHANAGRKRAAIVRAMTHDFGIRAPLRPTTSPSGHGFSAGVRMPCLQQQRQFCRVRYPREVRCASAAAHGLHVDQVALGSPCWVMRMGFRPARRPKGVQWLCA